MTPSADPPAVSYRPWYQTTVVLEGEGSGTVTIDAIITALLNQLLMGDSLASYEVRIQSVKTWVTDESISELLFEAYDYTRNNTGSAIPRLATINDAPGKNHFARAGFMFPAAIARALPYAGDSIVYGVSVDDGVRTRDHICLLWRTSDPASRSVPHRPKQLI